MNWDWWWRICDARSQGKMVIRKFCGQWLVFPPLGEPVAAESFEVARGATVGVLYLLYRWPR
jgi:hypothetical protein